MIVILSPQFVLKIACNIHEPQQLIIGTQGHQHTLFLHADYQRVAQTYFVSADAVQHLSVIGTSVVETKSKH